VREFIFPHLDKTIQYGDDVMSIMNYTTWVKEYKDGPFDVKVGYFPEEIYVGDLFVDYTDGEVEDMARKIDQGYYDWFVARVQYKYDGIEMGTSYLGGCLYENAEKTIVEDKLDGYLDNMLDEARDEAQTRALELVEHMQKDFL